MTFLPKSPGNILFPSLVRGILGQGHKNRAEPYQTDAAPSGN